MPTLVVLGQSGIAAAREAEAMLQRRPGAVALSVPGVGHDVRLERPEVLHQLLQEFLGRLADGERLRQHE